MLNWLLKRKSPKSPEDWCRVQQAPGIPFPFPKGAELRPEEDVMLALPRALISGDETIGSILICDDDAELTLNEKAGAWHIKLKAGMSFSLAKSSEIMIIADDKTARFFQLKRPQKRATKQGDETNVT